MKSWSGVERETECSIHVSYESSGTSEAPVVGGPPDGWDPGYHDETRKIKSIKIDFKELPDELVQELIPYLQEQVDEDDFDPTSVGWKEED